VNRPRIIVVDDEEDVAGYLAAALEDEGFEVASFTEAAPALTALRAEPPDLVSLDLLMPSRTGLWLYRQMREEPRLARVPVLVVTGLGIRRGLRSLYPEETAPDVIEPDAWIEKPIDLPRLLEAVRRLVSVRSEDGGR
jgi:two-component system cell cycle response regulator DivK